MPNNEGFIEVGLNPQVAILSTANSNGLIQRPLYGQVQADGSVALEVAVVSGGTGVAGGTSNTVAATAAGTSAATANPVQGVTGGVALPVSAASLPLPTGASQDGVDATGVTAPSGGSGLRGWLSGMYQKLSGLSFDASNNLKVNIVTGGAGGSSNTVVATAPGTTATTANPVQGVTGGVAMPVSGTVSITGSVATTSSTATAAGTTATTAAPIQGVTGGVPLAIFGSTGSTTTPNVTQLSDATTPTQRVSVSVSGALKVDNSAVTQPVSNASLTNLQFDASNNLKVNIVTGGAGGASNTVAATAAGTTATTANPIQGVTGGVAMPVSGALGTGTNPNVSTLRDGTSNIQATISAFHSADNQQPGGTAYGLLTGGVAQLLNAIGNLNRQTEASTDNVSQHGLSTSAQQMASPFATTSSTAISAASANATIVVVAASGFSRGSPWAIQPGSILSLDATNDLCYVTAVSGTSITVNFKAGGALAHSGTYTVRGFVYNQARDASIVDGSNGQGIGSSATQLFNSNLNSGLGGWEAERSASGELDGASGVGTAIAAGYEYNGGGGAGVNNYDRERNVQGKGVFSTTLTALATFPVSSIAVTSATGLLPGSPVFFEFNTANAEVCYVSANYTPGSLTVSLQTPTTITHASGSAAAWDVYTSAGPGLTGILPTGIGIEEDVVWNPADGKFYLERSATSDGMAGANIPAECLAVWNGTTFDRVTGSLTRGMDITAKNISFGTGGSPNITQLATGANAIGQIGGKSVVIEITPTVSTTTYATGNVVGGLFMFTNALLSAQTGIIQSLSIRCKTIQTCTFKFYLFKSNPLNSTWTDHAAPSISSLDVPFLTGEYPIAAPDTGLGTHTIYTYDGIGKLTQGATTTLYGVLTVVGTPTFASTSDLTLAIGIIQD